MFGPTASPVVHAQSTWHIGPTTWVFASRRTARFESVGSSCDRSQSRRPGSSPSSQRDSAIACAASAQTKHDARVIRSASTYVLTTPAALAPRVIESVRLPSVCASGTSTSSSPRPRSTTVPSPSSSYEPSSIRIGQTETGITATPVSASAASTNGSRSTDAGRPSIPVSSCRARIDAGSFLLGHGIGDTFAECPRR